MIGIVSLDPHGDENSFPFYLDGVAVDVQRPGRPTAGRGVPEQLEASML